MFSLSILTTFTIFLLILPTIIIPHPLTQFSDQKLTENQINKIPTPDPTIPEFLSCSQAHPIKLTPPVFFLLSSSHQALSFERNTTKTRQIPQILSQCIQLFMNCVTLLLINRIPHKPWKSFSLHTRLPPSHQDILNPTKFIKYYFLKHAPTNYHLWKTHPTKSKKPKYPSNTNRYTQSDPNLLIFLKIYLINNDSAQLLIFKISTSNIHTTALIPDRFSHKSASTPAISPN